jgi:hypothetical protein
LVARIIRCYFNVIIPAAEFTNGHFYLKNGNPPLCQALALAVGRKKRTGKVKIAQKERV